MADRVNSLSNQELFTILGALRWYQQSGMADDPDQRPDWLHMIVVNSDYPDGEGTVTSLDSEGIDDLCERINMVWRTTEDLEEEDSDGV